MESLGRENVSIAHKLHSQFNNLFVLIIKLLNHLRHILVPYHNWMHLYIVYKHLQNYVHELLFFAHHTILQFGSS